MARHARPTPIDETPTVQIPVQHRPMVQPPVSAQPVAKDPGFAAVALGVAIFGVIMWLGIGGAVGVVFSLISMLTSGLVLRRIDRGTGGGRGLAVAGFLLGLSGIVLPLVGGLLGF